MKYLALAFSAMVVFAGCETTGDPHHGGIFWSEEKAQERLEQKRRELRRIESDASRIEEENRQTQKESGDEG